MEQKSMLYLIDTLLNWSTIQIRTVPGVMYQVICRADKTYIHNHRFTFDTYCLEGEYLERLWEIVSNGNETVTYKLARASGNKLCSAVQIPGSLHTAVSRRHFPGNTLHVETNQYHSIIPVNQSKSHVVTFVAREIRSSAEKTTYILSSTDSIEAPHEEIRISTPEERDCVRDKLKQIVQRLTDIEWDKLEQMLNLF